MLDPRALILGSMAADEDANCDPGPDAMAGRNYLLFRSGSGYVRLHGRGFTCDPLWAERYTLGEAEVLCAVSPGTDVMRFNEETAGRRGRAIPLVERV